MRIFDDNVMLINPAIDASDKELHARNGFKTASKNLVQFIEQGDQATFANNIFRPQSLGTLTKDNIGSVKNIGTIKSTDINF